MFPVQKLYSGNGVPTKVLPRIKLCKNCKYFNSTLNTCDKFVSIDVVTGVEYPVLAADARSTTSICGIGAMHYENLESIKT